MGSYAIVTYTAGITAASDAGTKTALAAQLAAAVITHSPTYPDGPHYIHLNEAGQDFNFHKKYNGYEGRVFSFAYMTIADWYRIYGYSAGLSVDLYVRCPRWGAGGSGEVLGDFSAVMHPPTDGYPYAGLTGRGGVIIRLEKMVLIQ